MTDPCPGGCQHTIGRLMGELVKQEFELAQALLKVHILSNAVADLMVKVDLLEHEHALDQGRTIPDEAAAWLAEQGGAG